MVTYGVVNELRYNGLHKLLVAPVADESDQHLKQLTYQALKVHVVSILVCLHTVLHSAAYSWLLHCTWPIANVLQPARLIGSRILAMPGHPVWPDSLANQTTKTFPEGQYAFASKQA